MNRLIEIIDEIGRHFFINLIGLYKKFISPFLPKTCIFYPSCSDYALEAFKKGNFVVALFKTIYRVLRCNPFNKGGYDPYI